MDALESSPSGEMSGRFMALELPSLRPSPAPSDDTGAVPSVLEPVAVAPELPAGGFLVPPESVLEVCFPLPRIKSENAVVFFPGDLPTGAGGNVGRFLEAASSDSLAGCGSSVLEESGGVSSATAPFYTKFGPGGVQGANNLIGSKLDGAVHVAAAAC